MVADQDAHFAGVPDTVSLEGEAGCELPVREVSYVQERTDETMLV